MTTTLAQALDPQSRSEALDRMTREELDVLVVGAGVVGAGAALDAAGRGLKVGILEARDYAAGTSSRSSKLVHGGLRYLKQLGFPLVFEALRERKLILEKLAPHLARPVPFIYPLERPVWDRGYVGLGVGVYDVLGAGRGVPSHLKHLSKSSTMKSFRGAKPGAIKGGVLFYEGQLDDARHTMMLTRTAVSLGALAANSTQVTGFLREGDRVVGVTATDLETGRGLTIRAKSVINAAGVWTDELHELAGGKMPFHVTASKGVHILVDRDKIDSDTGLITETATSLLFVIPCPWSDQYWIIGTTDTEWTYDRAHPAATQGDIDYILSQVNRLLATPLTRDDVVGIYAGLRPLLAGSSDQTSKLSREHGVASPVPGLVMIAGGKYTTYRVMGKDAVDAAAKFLPGTIPSSNTEKLPLIGAEGYPALANQVDRLAAEHAMTPERIKHLLGRYGSAVFELFDLMTARPDLAEPLAGAPTYLRAEASYAVSHEGALHLDDILARRLRVSVDTPSRGVDVAKEVAELVAPLLGWDETTVAREQRIYADRVEAERQSNLQLDDAAADDVRLLAAESRSSVAHTTVA